MPGAVSLFANRVDGSGTVAWGTDGITVLSAANVTPLLPVAAPSRGFSGHLDGVLVTWVHQNPVTRPTFSDVHANRIFLTGGLLWGSSSVGAIVHQGVDTDWDAIETFDQAQPRIASDGLGGAIVVWEDFRDFHRIGPNGLHQQDLYGQRLNNSGVGLWTGNGAPPDTTRGPQGRHRIVMDRSSGVWIAYEDSSLNEQDVKAIRVDSGGSVTWTGIIAGVVNNEQSVPLLAADGAGGFLCVWNDERDILSTGDNVYGTHFDKDGIIFNPILDLTLPNGGEVWAARDIRTVNWTSNLPFNVDVEYNVNGGARNPINLDTSNDGQQSWEVPAESTSTALAFVTEVSAGFPADSSASFFTICPMFFTTINGWKSTGASPDYVQSGDFNEDGILDLAVATEESGNSISVHLGNGAAGIGDGTFQNAVSYVAASAPRTLVVDDFNDDGILDLAVTVTAGVSVLFGQGTSGVGDGTFGTAATFATGTNPQGVITADFNEDGIRDLAVANGVSDNVSILFGQGSNGVGNGTFGAASNLTVGDSPGRLICGDFNEDRITDLAVTNNGAISNSVSILVGRGTAGVGDGTFKAHVEYSVGANPWGICSGDFNQDGISDLAVANVNGNSVSILNGNGSFGVGDGTFAPAVDVPAGTNPLELVTLDFNVDGLNDIAALNWTQDRVNLIANDRLAVGFFFEVTDYFSTDLTPRHLLVGDFFEDGRPDIVSATRGDEVVNLLYGGCTGTPSVAVSLINANGGETWHIGAENTIDWSCGSGVMSVDIELSRDGGQNWEIIAQNVTEKFYRWAVTPPATVNALLRVRDPRASGREDVSDLTFIITDGVVDVTAPRLGIASLGPGLPNPFTGNVHLVLNVPEMTRGAVEVFDLAGRRVRTIRSGFLPAGRTMVTWDGLDEAGVMRPSGIYFVRAQWSGFRAIRKIVRVE
jgi:hypothetical protein